MSYQPSYRNGDWKVACDVCGRLYKASALTQRWDGLMCCPDDWEVRQPQDFVHGIVEHIAAPWSRPEQADQFVYTCTPESVSAIPALAGPGCMIPSRPYTPTPGIPYSFCTIDGLYSLADIGTSDCAIVGRI